MDVRTLEQLASGVRVLSGPHQALDGVAGPHVTVVRDADDAARAIGDALDAGLPTPAQMRVLLRSLFLNDATPVMLYQVTRRLGLTTDPLASRSVTAVVALDDGADIDAIVGSITGQAHLPRRTVIWRADGVTWPDAADTAIANAGIEIDVQTASAGRPDWSRLESDETTEWLSLWPSRRAVAPTFLLDLLIGGEMACADAVGYQPREGFEFVPSIGLESAIVRRGALPDAGGWRSAFDAVSTGQSDWESPWRPFPVGRARGRRVTLPRPTTPRSRTAPRRVLVYGDVNLNLIDGSAIWAVAVVEVFAKAGCDVTLLLKESCHDDAPDRAARGHAERPDRPAIRGGACS